jgi:preprotein translocase subunit SecG
MATVLLIIHIMLALALIGVVLLQRSEGGALGIGGGGGGFMTGRGAANFLTRVTAGLAGAFFVTSLILSLIAQPTQRSILDAPQAPASAPPGQGPRAPAPTAPSLPPIDLGKTNQGQQVPDTPSAPQGPRVPQSK